MTLWTIEKGKFEAPISQFHIFYQLFMQVVHCIAIKQMCILNYQWLQEVYLIQ